MESTHTQVIAGPKAHVGELEVAQVLGANRGLEQVQRMLQIQAPILILRDPAAYQPTPPNPLH